MKKEVIQLDNLAGCQTGARYLYNKLLQFRDVLSVTVNQEQGLVEIYHLGERSRAFFLDELAKKGFPEYGTSTQYQKTKAFISGLKGILY